MKDHDFSTQFADTPPQAQINGTWKLRTLRWDDFVWLIILSGLATLWMALLMSPAWR